MPNSIWKTYDTKTLANPMYFRVGQTDIWIKLNNSEIWVATSDVANVEEELANQDPPKDVSWARFAHSSKGTEIEIAPVFPNLPVIVSSEYPLKISAGAKIQIFTRIPVWVQVKLPAQNYVLAELPSLKLSRTWFGNPIEGELCYWQKTKARRKLSELNDAPYFIKCPITIHNKTHEDLDFEKFCYRVDRLSIFNVNNELWADETLIEYHGEDQNSDITMNGKLPSTVGEGTLLTKPRNPVSKSFATRTFKKLFDDTFSSDK